MTTSTKQRQAAIDALTACRHCGKPRTPRRPLDHDGYCPSCARIFAAYSPVFSQPSTVITDEEHKS